MANRRWATLLIVVGVVQMLIGGTMLLSSVLFPVRAIYAFWDRVSEMVVGNALDLKALDALMMSQGHPPSGLTAELIKAVPSSRPGGYDVIANWMLPNEFDGPSPTYGVLVGATGVLVIIGGFAVRPARAGSGGTAGS